MILLYALFIHAFNGIFLLDISCICCCLDIYCKNILRSRGKVEEVLSRCVTVYYLALCRKLHSETTTRSDEHVTSRELHLHYLQTAPLVVCFAHLPFVCRQLIELSMQQEIANFYSVWRRPQHEFVSKVNNSQAVSPAKILNVALVGTFSGNLRI